MAATTASNLDIARQANAHARADLATWQMMAKLKSTDALPREAQDYYASYQKFAAKMSETEASEAVVKRIYAAYYTRMGGTGRAPRIEAAPITPRTADAIYTDNVTPFRKIERKPERSAAQPSKPRMPVALIFIALCAIVVTIRYFL